MPTAADGGVEQDAGRDGREGLHDLVDHHRSVLERRPSPHVALTVGRGSPIGCPPDGGARRDVSPIG